MALASSNRDSSVLKKKISKVQSTDAISYAYAYRR
jgi:hypothetical protein